MKLVNYVERLDTKRLRRELYFIAKIADVSLRGIYVKVINARKNAWAWGRCYAASAEDKIQANGHIKLYVRPNTTWDELKSTFAHELGHLEDFRRYGTYPYDQERRADDFERDVMRKVNKEKTWSH